MQKRIVMKKRREQLQLTMKQAAKAAGISESYWSLIESGFKTPTLRVAGAIAQTLGLLVNEVFDEELRGRGGDAA